MATKKSLARGNRKTSAHPAKSHPTAAIVPSDDALLAEALRRGRDVVDGAETLLAGYGQWLFANLFAGDAKAVLDRDPAGTVWHLLTNASNETTLALSVTTISNTLQVAALAKSTSVAEE